jgi:hypothetical protein
MSKTRPNPPLGQYPQLRLYGQDGSAPNNRMTRTITRIKLMADYLLIVEKNLFKGIVPEGDGPRLGYSNDVSQ